MHSLKKSVSSKTVNLSAIFRLLPVQLHQHCYLQEEKYVHFFKPRHKKFMQVSNS
jgi:hypothetical protein